MVSFYEGTFILVGINRVKPIQITCASASVGKLVEYDEPMKLIKNEGSLFGQLVKEYWSRSSNGSNASGDWL